MLRFCAPLFFANVGALRDALLNHTVATRRAPESLRSNAVVLDCSCMASIDSTSLAVLAETLGEMKKNQVRLCFAAVPQQVSWLRRSVNVTWR